jgi:hypothetical protein
MELNKSLDRDSLVFYTVTRDEVVAFYGGGEVAQGN